MSTSKRSQTTSVEADRQSYTSAYTALVHNATCWKPIVGVSKNARAMWNYKWADEEYKICLYSLAVIVNTHRQCRWLETDHYKAERCPTNYEIVRHISHCHRYGVQNSSICHQCYCPLVQHRPVIRHRRHSISRRTESVGCGLAGSSVSTTTSRACVDILRRRHEYEEPTSVSPRWSTGRPEDKSHLQHHNLCIRTCSLQTASPTERNNVISELRFYIPHDTK